MTEQVSLKLNYPKQAGPHYQRYGWEMVKGDVKAEDLDNDVKYSSVRGEKRPFYGRDVHSVNEKGIHHYFPNVDACRRDDLKFLREDLADIKGDGSIARIQRLYDPKDGVVLKENSVTHFPKEGNMGIAKSVEILDTESGLYSVVRKNNAGEIVSGYEMNLKPQGRTFAQGFAGKLERAAMKLGSIGGGKERPVLSQVVELMFNVAKKIK